MVKPHHPPSDRALRFVVWQFVRVMVQLEKIGVKSHAFRAWRDQWQKLDRRLTRLGQSNRAGFSKLMMEEEVVIDKLSPEEVSDVRRALDTVIRQINGEVQSRDIDDETSAGLEFELTELATLRDQVRAMAPAPRRRAASRRPARPARKAKPAPE
ncbi:MAG: hypothetical protein GY791_18975 [Alphaproteobacteria bacterium]|nr:hypothetical protein [Alphaproteobacteria bacterium]